MTGTFASLIAPVVTTTSITLSSNKILNGDILVPISPDSPGKWPLKWRERETDRETEIETETDREFSAFYCCSVWFCVCAVELISCIWLHKSATS